MGWAFWQVSIGNIKSNPINSISGLVDIINSKYKLVRVGVYCIVQYQRFVMSLLVVDVVED